MGKMWLNRHNSLWIYRFALYYQNINRSKWVYKITSISSELQQMRSGYMGDHFAFISLTIYDFQKI